MQRRIEYSMVTLKEESAESNNDAPREMSVLQTNDEDISERGASTPPKKLHVAHVTRTARCRHHEPNFSLPSAVRRYHQPPLLREANRKSLGPAVSLALNQTPPANYEEVSVRKR